MKKSPGQGQAVEYCLQSNWGYNWDWMFDTWVYGPHMLSLFIVVLRQKPILCPNTWGGSKSFRLSFRRTRLKLRPNWIVQTGKEPIDVRVQIMNWGALSFISSFIRDIVSRNVLRPVEAVVHVNLVIVTLSLKLDVWITESVW